MPPLTRWFVKTGLVYLVAALMVGTLIAAQSVLELPFDKLKAGPAAVAALGPVYFHLLMLGWVTQLIFGVAYWLFPTYSKEKPRGSERLARATYGLLNVGLVLRVIGEPANALQPQTGWGWLLASSAILQWLAGLCFVLNTWGRIKGK
ncbi:MAG: hypothetical protein HY259_11360 [Chloroflexi bacterium]|nr:hypothetical protein [Chloroflexota bacterium]